MKVTGIPQNHPVFIIIIHDGNVAIFVNKGELSGSGLPKIRQGWENSGGILHLCDTFEPYDQKTRLEMTWGTILAGQKETPEKTPDMVLNRKG